MTRRTVRFFVTLTLALLVASLAVAAPPSAHVPRIGLLSVLSPAIGEAKAESFRQGLRELGYLERLDILLETAVHHPATFAGLPGQLGVYTPMPPALTRHDLEQMLAQGLSQREMSKRTGILRGTLQRLLKAPHVPEVLPEGRPEVVPGRPLPQSLVEAGPCWRWPHGSRQATARGGVHGLPPSPRHADRTGHHHGKGVTTGAIGEVWSARLRAWCTSVLPTPHRR